MSAVIETPDRCVQLFDQVTELIRNRTINSNAAFIAFRGSQLRGDHYVTKAHYLRSHLNLVLTEKHLGELIERE